VFCTRQRVKHWTELKSSKLFWGEYLLLEGRYASFPLLKERSIYLFLKWRES
jgi:hypothetical protein